MNTLTYSMTNRELLSYRKKMRRQRELRRKIVLSVLAVFLIFLFALCYGAIVSEANENTTDVSYKYFTRYEIEKGDTLWEIAKANIDYTYYNSVQDYIDEVAAINHLDSDTIVVGDSIIIPYFSNQYY